MLHTHDLCLVPCPALMFTILTDFPGLLMLLSLAEPLVTASMVVGKVTLLSQGTLLSKELC